MITLNDLVFGDKSLLVHDEDEEVEGDIGTFHGFNLVGGAMTVLLLLPLLALNGEMSFVPKVGTNVCVCIGGCG